MKILILSNTPWALNNSFGSTFSNFFGGIDGIEIANIYCRYGEPDDSIVSRYFQITEKSLIANLKNKNTPSGKEIFAQQGQSDQLEGSDAKHFGRARKVRLRVFFWARELIWKLGRWKSPQLDEFVDSFKPDLIFQPIYDSFYLDDIAIYLKKHTGAPMVGFIGDDLYTWKQFQLSPLFWIDRLFKRAKVRKVVRLLDKLYVMTETQKKEYDSALGVDCGLLVKNGDFSGSPLLKTEFNSPLKLVFTGNISAGRWKQLARIGCALEKINVDGKKAILDVYTLTPMTRAMRRALTVPSISLCGGIGAGEVARVQNDADILVHVEAFELKYRLAVRLSFSTKVIDYLTRGRCVFAVGPADVGSIEHLAVHNAALCATNKKDIYEKLNSVVCDTSVLNDYAVSGWECGRLCHNSHEVQGAMMNDFNTIIKNCKHGE